MIGLLREGTAVRRARQGGFRRALQGQVEHVAELIEQIVYIPGNGLISFRSMDSTASANT
jgi:hypothetical protein